jgi:predicted extracellular nuclease
MKRYTVRRLVLVVSAVVAVLGCSRETDDGSTGENGDDVTTGEDATVKGQDQIVEPDGDTGGGPGDTGGSDQGGPQGYTIMDCQQLDQGLNCAEGTAFINLLQGIDLKGVIVTSPVVSSGDKMDGFFVMDKAGGKYSGIKVVFAKGLLADIAVGDVLDLNGDVKEFYCMTEIEALASTEKSSGAAVTPTPVAAADVAATSAATEPYEGVLVKLENVKVATEPDKYGTFELEGGVQVDDVMFADMQVPDVGCSFTSLVGVIEYSYGAYKLYPRSAEDMVVSGEDCTTAPPKEDTVKGIQQAEGSTTCEDVAFGFSQEVTVKGLVITTPQYVVSKNKLVGYWAFDGEGGEFSGILLVFPVEASPAYDIGDKLDVTGTWQEYWCLTEISVDQATDAGSFSGTVPVLETTPDKIISDGEKYEGVLVTVKNVEVTEAVNQYGEFKVTGGLIVDDQIYATKPDVGTKYTSVTGVVSYGFGAYRLLPRFEADLAK